MLKGPAQLVGRVGQSELLYERGGDWRAPVLGHLVLLEHDEDDSRRRAHPEMRAISAAPPEVPVSTRQDRGVLVDDKTRRRLIQEQEKRRREQAPDDEPVDD